MYSLFMLLPKNKKYNNNCNGAITQHNNNGT